ncbi:MAG: DUF4249 domain-containing protein [Rhodothermales bacterium]
MRSAPYIQTSRAGLLALTAVVLLSACETTVEVDLPRHPPKIAVNSFFRPGYVWEVHLGEARSVVDGQSAIQSIDNARVEIIEDGRVLTTLPHVGEGLYRAASLRPETGKTYTLRASAPGYDRVDATDAVPGPISVTFTHERESRSAGSGNLKVTIRIADPPDQPNYYRLDAYRRIQDPRTGEPNFSGVRFRTDDPAITAENEDFFDINEENRFGNVYFTDALLTDGLHEINLDIEESFLRDEGTLFVNLYGISKAYYDYALSYELHQEARDNPFAEPVQVFTNVKNGFGIFAGFSRYQLALALN